MGKVVWQSGWQVDGEVGKTVDNAVGREFCRTVGRTVDNG
jgi:hypothetical protein